MTAADHQLARGLGPASVPWDLAAPRRAAVLAPLVVHQGVDTVLFLVRAASLRLHPGQIGFPGGGDAGDATPADCALRETAEEIGVSAERVQILGTLPPRSSSSGYLVHCFVGRLHDDALRLDATETERALFVPIAGLVQLARWSERAPARPGLPPSPQYDADGDRIWGLTGRFTRDLVAALRGEPLTSGC